MINNKKILLDLNVDTKNLKKDDIIIYQNGTWTNVSKAVFLDKTNTELLNLNSKINLLNETIDKLKSEINNRLETYHTILSNLVKEKE